MKHRRKENRSAHGSSSPPDTEIGNRDGNGPLNDCLEIGESKAETGKVHNGKHSESYPTNHLLANVVLCLILVAVISYRLLSKYYFLLVVTLLPICICLVLAIIPGQTSSQRVLPLALVLCTLSAQLPTFWGSAIAAATVVLFSLFTLPTGQSSRLVKKRPGPLAVLLSVVLLVTVLLTENFMVWVVSATFPASHDPKTAPPPLQDNGQIVLQYLLSPLVKRQVVQLRRVWNVQNGLVASLAAAFFRVEAFESHRTLYGLGCRAVLTLSAARFVRTISFLLTVLPSQNPLCYLEHYPLPPENLWEWIWVGIIPAAHGGCNDLVISGHATVTSTLACVAASVSDSTAFGIALWTMVVLDYFVEIYEGFHYSVDMWLGMVLVSLLWHKMAFLENQNDPVHTDVSLKPTAPISSKAILLYSIPPAIAFMQLSMLPKSTANFLIVAFVVATVIMYLLSAKYRIYQREYLHYAQHILLSLLYLAFGVYL